MPQLTMQELLEAKAFAFDEEERYKEELRKLLQSGKYLGRHIIEAAVLEIKGLRAFKASVEEALNSGNGSYRP